ncbi:hypothetical protein [Heyndrickxia acidicola]|uniref:Uncharacterized protein n=1 Tax=Heyndrickxia acidicola TaxID=209389 RepID=A0ABU6MAF6_9BACI|nr:hypothetical protein [Heyndrickxia acidicola]MED1201656.1 hypothetical protein [Heyndrickxia acidicola]
MPRKAIPINELTDKEKNHSTPNKENKNSIGDLNRMLASVLDYISDDDVEEIDMEYLLDHTEGLREWWEEYRESNRKLIEKEIKESLSELPLKDLEKIRNQIKENNK